MRISTIIPAYNEERLIGETLRRVREAQSAFTGRGWETELIVCDNNSCDRTAAIAAAAGATVVFEPVNQIARARNSGAAAATGDWLVFVDADSHPDVGLFDAVANAIASGRCIAGGSTVRIEGVNRKAAAATALWNRISRALSWAAGSFIFCDAAVFRQIGGFNSELFASEEIDLSRRLKRVARAQGRKLVILNQHPISTSPRKLDLYSGWELLGFLLRTVLTGGRTLRDRNACFTWYDGRR